MPGWAQQALRVAPVAALAAVVGPEIYSNPVQHIWTKLPPKGFKAGGFITLAGTPIDFAKFDPETLLSYELGAKTKWLDGRLIVNGNLFFMKNKDKLFTTLEPDTRSVTGTSLKASNNSDAESKGIELEAQFAVGDMWTFSGQFTHTEAKWYLRNSNATGVADLSFVYGATTDKPLVWR